MADTATETKVAAIVDRLLPLTQTTSGAPLRAEDWNTLAGAIVDLARLALSREQTADDVLAARFAARNHDHVGEVDASWFDPATRDLLDQAANGSAALRSDIAVLRDQLTATQKDIGALKDQLAAIQRRIDGLFDNDLARQQALDRVGVRFEAVRDVHENVSKLQGTFGGLTTKLDQALSFSKQLVDGAGNPINLAGLSGRVQTLESNQENLRGANGELIRFRDFEVRIGSLEGRAITRDNLDTVVADRVKNIDPTAIAAAVLPSVNAQVAPQLAALGSRVDKIDAKTVDLDGRLSTATQSISGLFQRVGINDAQVAQIGGLSSRMDGLTTRVAATETSLQQQSAVVSQVSKIADRLGPVEGSVATLLPLTDRVGAAESTIKDLRASISRVDALGARVDALEPVAKQVAGLAERVGVVETTVSKNTAEIAGVHSQVTVLESSAQDATARLSQLERARIQSGTGQVLTTGGGLSAVGVSGGQVLAGGVVGTIPGRGGG